MKNVNRILLSAMLIPMLLSPIKAFAGETITSYKVQNGDSLWKISTSTSLSIDYLKAVNNLNNLNMNYLFPGQILKLKPDVHNYIVKSGDTLWKIATANKLTVDSLKVLNKLSADNINVGQVIKLRPDTITYTVESGDTLFLLAKKFGSTVDNIKNINNLTGTNLSLKQQLLIPYNAQQVKSSVTSTVTESVIVPSRGVVATTPEPIKNFPSITYIVQAGNTATSIAKSFNVSVSDIMKYNYMGVDDWFSVGQKIAINGYAPRDYAVTKGTDKSPTQFGNVVDWYRDGQYLLKRNDVFTIVDFTTRKQFTVKVTGGFAHADIEPLTSSDTAVMKSLFSSWDWTPRPVVIFKDGMNIAGSLSGMPHSFNTVLDNGVSGHFDLY